MNKIKLYVAAVTAAEKVITGTIADAKAIADIQASEFSNAGFTAQADYDEFTAQYAAQNKLMLGYLKLKTPGETAQASLVAFAKPA